MLSLLVSKLDNLSDFSVKLRKFGNFNLLKKLLLTSSGKYWSGRFSLFFTAVFISEIKNNTRQEHSALHLNSTCVHDTVYHSSGRTIWGKGHAATKGNVKK